MFKMLNQFFAMLSTLFAAGEKGAKSLDHMASWAEDTAAAFKDEAAITRITKRKALMAKAGVTDAELATAEAEKAPVAEE